MAPKKHLDTLKNV